MNREIILLENEVPYEIRLAMENQVGALESYNNLIKSFPKDKVGLPVYPDEYAGAYIEQGNLVIQLIDDNVEMREKYIQLCGTNDEIKFEEVKYSLNELLQYESYALEMIADGYSVVGFGVCETSNSFKIYLEDDELSYINTLNIEADESPINFTIQDCPTVCVTLWGGDSLKNEDTGSTMTVGICGTYNGEKAILTCGHGNDKIVDG